MNNDDLVFKSELTVEQLKEMLEYMDEEYDASSLTKFDLDDIARRVYDAVEAAIESWLENQY